MSKRFAPRAEATKQQVADLIKPALSRATRVLELASGTGQQIAHFAGVWPEIEWWPSERGAIWLDSIAAWTRGLSNVREPTQLEIGEHPWPSGPFDAVLALNVLHLIDAPTIAALFAGAAGVLASDGALVTGGALATAATVAVEPAVPGWGVTISPPALEDVEQQAAKAGFVLVQSDPLPALGDSHRILRWSRRPTVP